MQKQVKSIRSLVIDIINYLAVLRIVKSRAKCGAAEKKLLHGGRVAHKSLRDWFAKSDVIDLFQYIEKNSLVDSKELQAILSILNECTGKLPKDSKNLENLGWRCCQFLELWKKIERAKIGTGARLFNIEVVY